MAAVSSLPREDVLKRANIALSSQLVSVSFYFSSGFVYDLGGSIRFKDYLMIYTTISMLCRNLYGKREVAGLAIRLITEQARHSKYDSSINALPISKFLLLGLS